MCEEMSIENILPHYTETLGLIIENDMQVKENYLPILQMFFTCVLQPKIKWSKFDRISVCTVHAVIVSSKLVLPSNIPII